jgi:hypothetical protein
VRGEFIGIWSETWREIWQPLSEPRIGDAFEGVSEDFFVELFRALAPALKTGLSAQGLADTIDDPAKTRWAFEKMAAAELSGERALVVFFEAAHDALEELGGDELTNRYFNLLAAFIDKFSLRYELRRPCSLCPTLPGMFASLVREIDALGIEDANVAKRLRDSREAVHDLRLGQTEGRIANCVAKQVMLLEAVAGARGENVGTDLAALCKGVRDWPHPAVMKSLLNLYGFASDFPGLRHGTPSGGMKRDIDMRDMLAMSILLTGFAPYLENRLSPDAIFGVGIAGAGQLKGTASTTIPGGSSSAVTARGGALRRFASRFSIVRLWKREG